LWPSDAIRRRCEFSGDEDDETEKDLDNEIFRKHYPDMQDRFASLTPIPGTSWIAFPDKNDTVVVFDLAERQEEFRLESEDQRGRGVVLNNDRRSAARRASDCVGSLASSHDGLFLAATVTSAGSSQIVIWDLKSRKLVARQTQAGGSDLEFSPNGKWLAVASNEIYLWDVSSYTTTKNSVDRGNANSR